MPNCNSCGTFIQSGQYCDVCWREEPTESLQELAGPEYTDCEHCDGRAWIEKDGSKVDCPECAGLGLVPATFTDDSQEVQQHV